MFHNAINTPDKVKILSGKSHFPFFSYFCYEMDNRKRFSSLHATIAALREGSIEAFDALYNQFVGKVHNFIKKISGDNTIAEDITQEVFIKLWRRREELDPDLNIESWLFVCSKNLFLNEMRHRRHQDDFSAEIKRTAIPAAESTMDQVLYHLAEQSLADTIRSMPPQQQKIFLLSKFQGLSAAEIASMMSISERTVENQLYQARKLMLSRMKDKS